MVRFLWYEDMYKENPELVTLRFCRVVFGLTCSPFLLNGTISAHLEQFNGYVNLFANLYAIYMLMTHLAVSMILKMLIAFLKGQNPF